MSSSLDDETNDLFSGIDVPSPSASLINALGEFDSNEGLQLPPLPNCLAIIAQPGCSSYIRYRTEYLPPSTRRDPLITNNSTYNGPALYIPPVYLDVTRQYYIGVSLATLMHEKTNCRYIHPYELESIDNNERNDRDNNIVWFLIEDDDQNGIKSFPDLRIVIRIEKDLKKYGNLRPFHGCNSNLLNNVPQKVLSIRQIVPEYNLKKAQLAFCIGQKMNITDEFPTIIDPHLIIFSDEMRLLPDEETTGDGKSNESAAKVNATPPPDCRMYKYAPRYGDTEGNEEILIFFTKKLDERKYGKLQIKFESATPNINWSAEIDTANIEVKDQMVSFRTPRFLSSINEPTAVKIILQQRDRILEPLRYFYIVKSQCMRCQVNAMDTPNPVIRINSNKRTKSSLITVGDYETDAIVPVSENNPVFRQSKSEPESNSSNSTSRSSINTNETYHDDDPLSKKVYESIPSLFTNNDLKPLLRACRLFIVKRPELLYEAIDKNYSDLVSTFVPVAGDKLLQHKNQLGETVLLHATRLNHVSIVKALLERKNSNQLLEHTNDKGQNIFHILAMNIGSDELLDLFIDHLLKNSINISEKFDHVDKDNHRPLQLAISNNNLSTTRHLLKYFNKNVCETSNNMGDNLIHLAVRHGDLTMLKYLLDEEQLIEQRNQSNLTMTPIELAESMNRVDMVEYLKEKYPKPEIVEEESSEND